MATTTYNASSDPPIILCLLFLTIEVLYTPHYSRTTLSLLCVGCRASIKPECKHRFHTGYTHLYIFSYTAVMSATLASRIVEPAWILQNTMSGIRHEALDFVPSSSKRNCWHLRAVCQAKTAPHTRSSHPLRNDPTIPNEEPIIR